MQISTESTIKDASHTAIDRLQRRVNPTDLDILSIRVAVSRSARDLRIVLDSQLHVTVIIRRGTSPDVQTTAASCLAALDKSFRNAGPCVLITVLTNATRFG